MWLRRGDTGTRFGSAWSGTGALPASLEKGARAPGLRSEEAWLPRRRICPAGHGCVWRSRAGNRGQQTGGQRIVDLHISPLESYIQIWCTEDFNITLISL